MKLLEFFFGCWHVNLSVPFGKSWRMYRRCLDCGQKFPFQYDEVVRGELIA